MLSKRIIACLDVRDGHLAKSIKFVNTKNIGDPVEKAREYARRGGEGARFTDGGLSHDVTWIVSKYGIVPESSYVVVEDYDLMRAELDAVLEARAASADWSEEAVVAEGAAAAPVGALLQGLVQAPEGSKVVVVLSGGNLDVEQLRGLHWN